MTREDIIRMAREAGLNLIEDCCDVPNKFCGQDVWKGNLYVFAALVAENERGACAKVCEESNDICSSYGLAQAIRARGQA